MRYHELSWWECIRITAILVVGGALGLVLTAIGTVVGLIELILIGGFFPPHLGGRRG